jgi:hypothetical protein
MTQGARIVCNGCRHFYVTHDPALPWGCRSFGFRAAQLPNFLVRAATGTNCASFEQKPALTAPKTRQNVRKPA